jgi:hypothetical protein
MPPRTETTAKTWGHLVLVAAVSSLAMLLGASVARAAPIDPAAVAPDPPKATPVTDDAAKDAEPKPRSSLYVRTFATLGGGVGLRFNNPYRLSRQLGDDAKGLSSTAPYVDVGVGATFGNPFGWQHGAVLRYDHSLSGVTQHVVTPSYIGLRRFVQVEVWGRVGLPVVLTPDRNLGGELALGAAWFFRAGLGLGGELVGDLFFGAATPEAKNPVYPVLSGQLFAIVEWERLP